MIRVSLSGFIVALLVALVGVDILCRATENWARWYYGRKGRKAPRP